MMGMKSRVIILGALVSLMAGCGSTKQHARSASSEDMMLETKIYFLRTENPNIFMYIILIKKLKDKSRGYNE